VLEGLAQAKPGIVLGGQGTAGVVDERSLDHYREHGFLEPPGSGPLTDLIEELLDDRDRRLRLGALGQQYVVAHRSADEAAATLDDIYRAALVTQTPRRVAAGEAAVLATRYLRRRVRRVVRPRSWVRRLFRRG
jgi:hypothetical protein